MTSVPASAGTRQQCQPPSSLVRFTAPLSRFPDVLLSGEPVRIVALGSSSTEGIGASNPGAGYPVRLQAELRRRLPGPTITVDNLGISGQLASDMLRRIKTQVLPRRPALVIWQTGVNDAVQQVNIEVFRHTVLQGIDKLQKSGVDVVLLDMQYFPGAEKIPNFSRYLVAMRQIAKDQRVPLVQRYAIMRHLVSSAQYTPRQLLASDLFHPNDFTYDCLGKVLANALQDEVKRSRQARHLSARVKQAGDVLNAPVH